MYVFCWAAVFGAAVAIRRLRRRVDLLEARTEDLAAGTAVAIRAAREEAAVEVAMAYEIDGVR